MNSTRGDDCDEVGCRVPVPHRHTGEWVDTTTEEWWCPTEARWVWCPGPCPDGTAHDLRRTSRHRAERIEVLTAAPSSGEENTR